MTVTAFEAQASWLPTVSGLRCSAVRTDGEQMLSLHFGEFTEGLDGEIEAERTITMEGAWRVEQGSEVLAGSADPDDEREEFLDQLIGVTLERFEVSRPGYDLTLYLHDGFVVRCFPVDSLEYAEQVEDPEDVQVSWWVTGDGIPDDWESANTAG
jgi:hypothetical protein